MRLRQIFLFGVGQTFRCTVLLQGKKSLASSTCDSPWQDHGESQVEVSYVYFDGKWKRKRWGATPGKSIEFGFLQWRSLVYTKVVESMSTDALMRHIQNQHVQRLRLVHRCVSGLLVRETVWEHHTSNYPKTFVSRRWVNNHNNGIEGFLSYFKHILYTIEASPKIMFCCP